LKDWLYCRRLRLLCVAGEGLRFWPESRIYNSASAQAITIGQQCYCRGQFLIAAPDAKIIVGDWCSLGPNSIVWAMERIEIGSRVFLSHGVQIFDNNSHSMSANDRHDRYRELRTAGRHLRQEDVRHEPVRIEDDAWIGFNAIILKGVTVGRGAVVGACSVVTHDVEPYSIVVGNPACKVGESYP
jgi:acetyltransferase-like isoleucine patch superfamily enzyme